MDMLVYDDSDDEGHDDDLDVSRRIALQLVQYFSRYLLVVATTAMPMRVAICDSEIIPVYHTLFFLFISPCPPSSLAWGYYFLCVFLIFCSVQW